jgi:hypothetical protein
MLLHIDGGVVEIRPSEFFESKNPVESRYLQLITEPKKKGRPSKKTKETLDGSSSSTESRS